MSLDNMEKKQDPRSEQPKTEDLEMKLMEVGTQKYHVDMRQNGESRFFRITEASAQNRMNRVVVPMCVASDFCKRIHDTLKFASTYTPKNISEKKGPRDRAQFSHSLSFTTPGFRKYYFDVIDADSTLTLRISYVFMERRDSIHILVEALPNFLEILDNFQRNYPSISLTDDYPATVPRRRFDSRRPMNGRPGRGFMPQNQRNYNRNFRGPKPEGAFNGKPNVPRDPREPMDPKRSATLKVLSDPSPATIVNNAKKYTFEVVEGANTFLRITEIINSVRKSTLHVPMEICSELQDIIGDMNKKFSLTQKTASAAPPSQA